MTIRIGSLKLEAAVPDDLHRRLLASTGCSIAEIAAIVASPCIAGSVAAALLPLLVEALPKAELACLIAADGIDAVRRRVARIYAALSAKAAPSNPPRAALKPKKEPIRGQ